MAHWRIKVQESTGKIRYNLYNEARQLVAQYEKPSGGSLTWKKDIVYIGAKEIAEVSSDGKRYVTLSDHLGSPRFIWDGATTPVQQKLLPFGENLADPTSAAKFAKGFTNHEQTDPSGLIYMQARFYLPMYGRFASPDPARDQHFEQTQSWNIYSYVRNVPTLMTDPTGMVTAGNPNVENQQLMLARNRYIPKTKPETVRSLSQTKGLDVVDKGEYIVNKAAGGVIKIAAGTSQERVKLASGVIKLLGSLNGEKKIKKGLERHNGKINIYVVPDKSNAYWRECSSVIRMNPEYSPLTHTTKGYIRQPNFIALGHEFGHAAGGPEENGLSNDQDMKNIIMYENPIRRDFGIPERTRYR